MSLDAEAREELYKRVPRASGDEPSNAVSPFQPSECSPRERG